MEEGRGKFLERDIYFPLQTGQSANAAFVIVLKVAEGIAL